MKISCENKSLWAAAACILFLTASPFLLASEKGKNAAKPSPYIATNKEVLAFTKQTIGTKVGRGECWDLARQALDFSGSLWKHPYQFGFLLSKSDAVLPGDIVQFSSARFEWRKGNRSGWKLLGTPEHTSIVYAVKGTELQLAHQNVNGVRKVFLDTVDLNNVVSGSYKIFRPYKLKR